MFKFNEIFVLGDFQLMQFLVYILMNYFFQDDVDLLVPVQVMKKNVVWEF